MLIIFSGLFPNKFYIFLNKKKKKKIYNKGKRSIRFFDGQQIDFDFPNVNKFFIFFIIKINPGIIQWNSNGNFEVRKYW